MHENGRWGVDLNMHQHALIRNPFYGEEPAYELLCLRDYAMRNSVPIPLPPGATNYDSLTETRELLSDPSVADVLRNVTGIAVSPDQQWLAAMLRNGNVVLLPLADGIPDLSGIMLVNTAMGNLPGRDVAFDAAGNLHCIVGGQSSYRIIAPGGTTYATTSWNGQSYSFSVSSVPEPASLGLIGSACIGAIGVARRRT